jgi:hypothetical protein
LAIFIFVIRHLEKLSKNYSNLISLSHLQTKPAAEGQTSPEKTDRGYELRSQGPATLGLDALRVAAVARTMAERDEFLADIRFRLEQAQATQKKHYDKGHRHIQYQVGEWALLRLRQRTASGIPQATAGKLKPRFFGPYRITELINDVAVRLDLPPGARIHDVFHVGLLKKFVGVPPEAPPPLPEVHHGAVSPEPERAVRYRLARGVQQVLIQWKGQSASSNTWEDRDAFAVKYPAFQLEDELTLDGGGDVMVGRTYSRRRRARDVRRAAARAEQLGAAATSG